MQEICNLDKETLALALDTLIDAGLLENDLLGNYLLQPVLLDYIRLMIQRE